MIQGRRPERCYPNCINQDGRCIYCGWAKDEEAKMAREGLWTYDIHNDEMRPVTQADIETWSAVVLAYSKLRQAVAAIQADLMTELETIASTYGQPHDPGKPIPAPAAPVEQAVEQAADPDPGA